MNQPIILASTSPRRKQLLSLLGVKFTAVDSGYEEVITQDMPHEKLVVKLALGKAEEAAKKYKNAIIIAADTIVSFNGKALGKPKTKDEAVKVLKSLSGKKHLIITGLIILNSKTKKVFKSVDVVKVFFNKLSDQEILAYVKTKEPFDRAGAYAFQHKGFNLVKKIEGHVSTAIGMPMEQVYNGLKIMGVKI
jgi:septum formation protein